MRHYDVLAVGTHTREGLSVRIGGSEAPVVVYNLPLEGASATQKAPALLGITKCQKSQLPPLLPALTQRSMLSLECACTLLQNNATLCLQG